MQIFQFVIAKVYCVPHMPLDVQYRRADVTKIREEGLPRHFVDAMTMNQPASRDTQNTLNSSQFSQDVAPSGAHHYQEKAG